MAEENSFVYGIIHIGSSSLSMRIVEYKDADTIRVIEEVRKETTFGEEVFINKKLCMGCRKGRMVFFDY